MLIRIHDRDALDALLLEDNAADRLALADVLERDNDRDLEIIRVREMEADEAAALARLDALLALDSNV